MRDHADPVNIGDDAPIRLAEACASLFGGRITPATLRAEAKRGRLVIERYGNKLFVTPKAIREMREKCRVPQRVPASISTSDVAETPPGSSETAKAASERASVLAIVERLRKPSVDTSPQNISPELRVLKLPSRTS